MKRIAVATLFAVAAIWGCGTRDDPGETPEAAAPTEAPELLPRPFTAEQIRDEMVVGFKLRSSWKTPEGIKHSLWTVVAADTEGVEIEYADLDESGNAIGEPNVKRSTWMELRDHASFPAATSSRKQATRTTPVGELDGWIYFVVDEAEGTATEFFFAQRFPGPPVHLITARGDEPILEMVQLERSRPSEVQIRP